MSNKSDAGPEILDSTDASDHAINSDKGSKKYIVILSMHLLWSDIYILSNNCLTYFTNNCRHNLTYWLFLNHTVCNKTIWTLDNRTILKSYFK
jgi:hypothetical protein